MFIDKYNSIYFIGIGGIGISAVARMFLNARKQVAGSDIGDNLNLQKLRSEGIQIFTEPEAKNLPPDTDLVIYTIAIKDDNPELIEAKKRGIKVLTYPQALAEISAEYFTIAVCGTHGKTTTTAMIAHILYEANYQPTVIVGSLLANNGSNFIAGGTAPNGQKYLVVEACEYCRSFLNINPSLIVITNIEEDHLDYYKDLDDIKKAFKDFVHKLPQKQVENKIVIDLSLPNTKDVVLGLSSQVADIYNDQTKIDLSLPGEHNLFDAKLAVRVAEILGIDKTLSVKNIKTFQGTWRRLEYKGEKDGIIFYDDYGHHPTEIKATLSALQTKFPERKLIVAFQPHLFSRTKSFLNEFAAVLSEADLVLLAPIYPAREKDDGSISSQILADQIIKAGGQVMVFQDLDFTDLTKFVSENLHSGELFLTLGAGDINKVTDKILKI